MKSLKDVDIPGISADDDRDIQIIEDLTAIRHDPGGRTGLWGETRSLLRDIFFAILIAVLIVVFIVQPVRVEGQSMMPKLNDQDRIFVNKFIYPLREWLGDREPIKRGDIVVLLFPDDPSKSYIKRVVGLPGEKVRIESGKLYVNSIMMNEPYLDADYLSYDEEGPTEIKAHHYFVLGDNRRNSSDSRAWGLVPEKYIYGKAIFRYYPFLPFEHVGLIE